MVFAAARETAPDFILRLPEFEGPLDLLLMTGDGTRRVRLRYRIGLFRLAMNGLQVFVEGRPLRLKAVMEQAKQAPEDVCCDEDEELIRAIHNAQEDE